MKKNLFSVIILVLLIVNIVLTSVMMLSVTSTNKKTADLVTKIAGALDMELASTAAGEEEQVSVSMEDTETYDIADAITIPLKKGADGKDHYFMVTISLAMDKKNDGYNGNSGADNQADLRGDNDFSAAEAESFDLGKGRGE